VQPLAEIGIGLAQHARAGVDCTRSTAASAVRPVAIASRSRAPSRGPGEHAVGFEHVAMLARDAPPRGEQHVVDRSARNGPAPFRAAQLGFMSSAISW
jgi:hypothetical protein